MRNTDKYGVNKYLNDDGFWHIPCTKCLKNRIINDRRNAVATIKNKTTCSYCANYARTGTKNITIRGDRKYNYDLYYVSLGVWNLPCPKCLKDRNYSSTQDIRRALDINSLCKSCALTGVLRKPDRKKRRNQQTWSSMVKNNYDNKCAVCFSANNLEGHHILPVIAYPELFNVVSNGICLCNNCHKEFHTLNGKYQIK